MDGKALILGLAFLSGTPGNAYKHLCRCKLELVAFPFTPYARGCLKDAQELLL